MSGDDLRIEAGNSGISPEDLRSWGLAGEVAWTMVSYEQTSCRDKAAKLELLKCFADDIIKKVKEGS